jgi:hypothetical protein
MVERVGLRHVREVVEHHRTRQVGPSGALLEQVRRRRVDLHVPAEPGHTRRQRLDHVERRGARRRQVEANATYTALVQLGELLVGDARVDHGDSSRPAVELRDRSQQQPVVDAVTGGLDNHVARGAQAHLQPPVVGDGGLAGLQGRLRRPRELRVVDVVVAVGRVGRQLGARSFGADGPLHRRRRLRRRAAADTTARSGQHANRLHRLAAARSDRIHLVVSEQRAQMAQAPPSTSHRLANPPQHVGCHPAAMGLVGHFVPRASVVARLARRPTGSYWMSQRSTRDGPANASMAQRLQTPSRLQRRDLPRKQSR